jgi:hypothetical protein
MPLLTLCICSLVCRHRMLAELLAVLLPQITGDVQLLIDIDDGDVSIGSKRSRMLNAAAGEYVCFIDDDDSVAPDYVSRLLAALESHPDCVGFKLSRLVDGSPGGEAIHSLRFDRYANKRRPDGSVLYERTPNHLNPVRTDLVRRIGFPDADWGEDSDFAERIRPLLQTEVMVEADLYIYQFRAEPMREHERTHIRRQRTALTRRFQPMTLLITPPTPEPPREPALLDVLIKFPSRQRPLPFFRSFRAWDNGRVRFLVTLDQDDPTLPEYLDFLKGRPNVKVDLGQHRTKIEAINSGVADQTFDIVIAAADDMIPQRRDYDLIISRAFLDHAPDLDAAFYCPDGRRTDDLNTNVVLGSAYFARFGYLYHPAYITLWADNELSDVARGMGREIRHDQVLLRHEWTEATGRDALHLRNESPMFQIRDKMTYHRRKAVGFPAGGQKAEGKGRKMPQPA